MSSDGFFSDELDTAFIDEVDAIEAAQISPPRPRAIHPPRAPAPVIDLYGSDDYDVSCNFDDADLEVLDNVETNAYVGGPTTSKARASLGRTPSMTVQRDLFGNIATPGASGSRQPGPSKPAAPTLRSVPRSDFGGPQKKTKHWDHTQYAKSGWKKRKSKGKGRAEDGEDGEDADDDRLPPPFISGPEPMTLKFDPLAIKHWTYPLNKPKRDYQFNIVKHCLFENTLVALPTGLGKTFIAGVVMLNFYHWFPEGKVVFVAPTKPLVAQQVQACHKVCGIPGSDAAELTGEVAPAMRERLWISKRVIFLTPQTLINDLSKNVCDAKSIVLIVIDEAHKGTGDYAYAQVVRYMMATNPHHRILALTATPGGKPETVQTVVDSLHISRIEIRNEDSLDLTQYLHKKIMKQHILPMSHSIVKLRDMIAKLMEPKMTRLQRDGLLRGAEPTRMHSYRPQAEMKNILHRPDKARLQYAYPMLSALGRLARAMGYLAECSVNMCYSSLKDLAEGTEDQAKTKKVSASGSSANPSAAKLKEVQELRAIMNEIDAQRRAPAGLPLHPKLVELKNLVIQHFGALAADTGSGDDSEGAKPSASESRVMVFASYREIVDEIVDVLNQEKPLIRAMKLVGQSSDRQGNAGQNQKAQQAVLDRFKAGEGNVLVATSIGEEGLDIGEIDMVICYDAQKTPIRMLQRVGRTGRKGNGYVHILMAEGREEDNWNKSEEAYKDVQRAIVQADQLELFADVPRLLPDNIKPAVHEQVMEIEEYSRENSKRGSFARSPKAKIAKRKRNDQIERNIPAGAATGFTNVSDMLRDSGAIKKGKGKAKAKPLEFDPNAADDDETDAEIEAGVFGPARVKPTPRSKSKRAKKATTQASTSKDTKDGKARATLRKKTKEYVEVNEEPQVVPETLQDDSDDEAIAVGLFPGKCSGRVIHAPSRSPLASARTVHRASYTTPTPPQLRSPSPEPWPESDRSPSPPSIARPTRHKSQSISPRLSLHSPNHISPTSVQCSVEDDVIDLASSRSDSPMIARTPDYWSPTQAPPRRRDAWSPVASPSPTRNKPSRSSEGIDATSADVSWSSRSRPSKRTSSPATSRSPEREKEVSSHSPSSNHVGDVSWLLGDSDDERGVLDITSSPGVPRYDSRLDTEDVIEIEDSFIVPAKSTDKDTQSLMIADRSVDESPIVPKKRQTRVVASSPAGSSAVGSSPAAIGKPHKATVDTSVEIMGDQLNLPSPDSSPVIARSRKRPRSGDMAPPALPARFTTAAALFDEDLEPPEPTLPVRAAGSRRKRTVIIDSSPLEAPPASQRRLQRLQRHRTSPAPGSPQPKRRKREKRPIDVQAMREYIVGEAAHSGDEVSEGSSGEDDPESESDHRFLQELDATQASPSYNQSLMYRQSLFTQAPSGGPGPRFAGGPVRVGRFGPNKARPQFLLSSSPARTEDDEPDEYMMGSFVVDDDEEVSYEDD